MHTFIKKIEYNDNMLFYTFLKTYKSNTQTLWFRKENHRSKPLKILPAKYT